MKCQIGYDIDNNNIPRKLDAHIGIVCVPWNDLVFIVLTLFRLNDRFRHLDSIDQSIINLRNDQNVAFQTTTIKAHSHP